MDNTISILLSMLLWNRGYMSSTSSPFFVSDNTCTWSPCKAHCADRNGRLIVLDSQPKYDLMKQYLGNILSSIELFIGLYTTTNDCTNYTWINGDLLSWSKWDLTIDEPNSCDNDVCVRLYRGLFRTTHCSTGFKALCEYVTTESSSSMTSATTSKTTATTTETSSSRATMFLSETSTTPLSTSTTKNKAESSELATTSTLESPSSSSSSSSSMSLTTFMTMIETSAAKESSSEFPIRTTTSTELNTQNGANSAAVIKTTDITITETEATTTAHIRTSDPPKTYDPCRWIRVNDTQLTQAELQETVDLLKVQLTVQKNSTSIALRKRISVYDSRPSSLAMGGVAAAILSVMIGWIVIPDVISLFTYLCSNVNNSNIINP